MITLAGIWDEDTTLFEPDVDEDMLDACEFKIMRSQKMVPLTDQ